MTEATVAPAPRDIAPGRLFIDGEYCDAVSGKTFSVHYPATGEVLTQCAEGDAADIDRAVKAARAAQPGWAGMTPGDRGRLVQKLGDMIASRADELARLTTLEMGKPIMEARFIDLNFTPAVFHFFGEFANKLYGETCPVDVGYLNYTLREPLGVVAAITPWNFPLTLAAWKVAPALAMGNAVVLKPAEQSPLASLRLGQLAMDAGIPKGVLNVVSGFGPGAGAALSAHLDVDKIAFTGEHFTGQKIMQAAAGNLKKISLECGGKSPHIVFPDADLEGAGAAVFNGIFLNQGQVCNAGSRLFVHKDIAADFVGALVERTRAIRLGDPLRPETEMGPLVSMEQKQRVLGYVEAGLAEGARALCGGVSSPLAASGGYYVEPTLLGGVRQTMRVAREEIFGPVLSVLEFEDEADLVRQANDTIYGLGAGIWTRDLGRAHRLARAIQAGTVWVNCYNIFDVSSPFGGYKISGMGKEHGRHALDLYTQVKSVWIKL